MRRHSAAMTDAQMMAGAAVQENISRRRRGRRRRGRGREREGEEGEEEDGEVGEVGGEE